MGPSVALRERLLDFVESTREVGHLDIHLGHEILQPVHAVENLYALSVRIVSNLERSAHGVHLDKRDQ